MLTLYERATAFIVELRFYCIACSAARIASWAVPAVAGWITGVPYGPGPIQRQFGSKLMGYRPVSATVA
jgi:hypothetical protein